MKLSILIPYTEDRSDMVIDLVHKIRCQSTPQEVEILTDVHPTDSIGKKCNRLMDQAKGEYVCRIDSDDDISDDYISSLMYGINNGFDCCSLRGVITWDGSNPELFEHSVKYHEWRTNHTSPIKYERTINHLNCVKASIAKQFKFPDISHGEDRIWSEEMYRSGLIKTEYFIDKVIYHYKFIRNK